MNASGRIFALSLFISCSPEVGAGELGLSANTPEVRVSTRPEGRNFINLPLLRYDFILTPSCPARSAIESVSLSIADTRVSLDRKELTPGPRLELSIDVPAAQIAPVAVENFCTAHSDGQSRELRESLTIPALLSAQAALLCMTEDGGEMSYASKSLDVLLRCEARDEPGG